MKILFLDDVARHREKFVADAEGHEVTTVHGSRPCIAALKEDQQWDIVFLDWNLFESGSDLRSDNGTWVCEVIAHAKRWEDAGRPMREFPSPLKIGKFVCHSSDPEKAAEMVQILREAGQEAVAWKLEFGRQLREFLTSTG